MIKTLRHFVTFPHQQKPHLQLSWEANRLLTAIFGTLIMFHNLSNITKNVSGWLGATKGDEPDTEVIKVGDAQIPDKETEKTEEKTVVEEEKVNDEEKDDVPGISEQLEEVSAKAISSAKEWGSYFMSVGKMVTEKAAATAKNVKQTVEERTIIGEFEKEQEKFVSENRDRHSKSEVAVPPWVGFNEEEQMKSQILALSSDKRNFVRNPPSGVQFDFDFSTSYPVAMAMLQEDQKLNKMRFELVPKHVKEEIFWRNYFYRVSLIKQSAQLSSLEQEREAEQPKPAPSMKSSTQELSSSPTEHEFISDDYSQPLNEEELRKDMEQLKVNEKEEKVKAAGEVEVDEPEWDQLAAELQDYEMVAEADDEIDQELLDQIEKETSS